MLNRRQIIAGSAVVVAAALAPVSVMSKPAEMSPALKAMLDHVDGYFASYSGGNPFSNAASRSLNKRLILDNPDLFRPDDHMFAPASMYTCNGDQCFAFGAQSRVLKTEIMGYFDAESPQASETMDKVILRMVAAEIRREQDRLSTIGMKMVSYAPLNVLGVVGQDRARFMTRFSYIPKNARIAI